MSYEHPESLLEQLLVVRQRQAELRSYARPRPMPEPEDFHVGRHRLAGPHFHIGTLVVAIGRTLYDEEGKQSRSLRSRPLGS